MILMGAILNKRNGYRGLAIALFILLPFPILLFLLLPHDLKKKILEETLTNPDGSDTLFSRKLRKWL
jgi:hypothetical protein